MEALTKAGITADKIGTVLAVGGITKMPRVRDALTAAVGKEPIRPINPDEAVAIGAALLAGKKIGAATGARGTVSNFLPLAIGVETAEGIFTPIIPAGTMVPCERRIVLSTRVDAQNQVKVKLYQGERAFVADNFFIAEAVLRDIPQMPRSFPQIDIKINVDVTGFITAIVREKITDISTFGMQSAPSFGSARTQFPCVVVRKGFGGVGRWGGLPPKQIAQYMKIVEQHRESDKTQRDRIEAVLLAEYALHNTSRELVSLKAHLSPTDSAAITAKITSLKEAIKSKNSTADAIAQAIGELDTAAQGPVATAVTALRKSTAL